MDQLRRTLDELQHLHASGFHIDVDELRPALAGSDEWWDLLFNTIEVGIVVLDREARVIAVNSSFAALLDRDEAEIRRLGMAGLTHPDDVASDGERFIDLMSGNLAHYDADKRYLKGDGTMIWGRTRVIALREGDGETRFSVALIDDVTQARSARDYGARLQEERSWRERALKLNDLVLQGLVVIKWAVARDDTEIIEESADAALAAGKDLMDLLFADPDTTVHIVVPDDVPPPISLRLDQDR